MSQEIINLTLNEGLAEVVLQRPDHYNSFSKDLRVKLEESLQEIENHPDVRIAIIRGDGPGFCAGADLTEAPENTIPEQLEHEYKPIFKKIVEGKKLYVAAVHGSAAGIGAACASAASSATSRQPISGKQKKNCRSHTFKFDAAQVGKIETLK